MGRNKGNEKTETPEYKVERQYKIWSRSGGKINLKVMGQE
jgi:hypothetical protein